MKEDILGESSDPLIPSVCATVTLSKPLMTDLMKSSLPFFRWPIKNSLLSSIVIRSITSVSATSNKSSISYAKS